MKLLVIGDPHLKISRLELSKHFLAWIGKVVDEEKPDWVINLGDTFDTHAVLRSEILEEFKQHVLSCINKGCGYFYLLGNHDMYKPNDAKYHALQAFKELHRRFKVIDEPFHSNNMSFIPYVHDHTQFPVITREICFAHQTFIGADYGFKRADAGVDLDAVTAELVVSGHIHRRQTFGKCVYPGTPYSQNADDTDQEKGVMVLDTETLEYRFIDCPLPKWRSLKYEIARDFNVQTMHDDLALNLNNSDHWLVDIVGPKAEISAYVESKQFAAIKKGVDIRIRTHPVDKEKEKTKIKAVTVDQVVSDYFDKVYRGSLNRDVLKTKAIEILRTVKSS